MRRRVSKQELVERLEAVERRLDRLEASPLAGQETIPVIPTVHDHHYEGPGPCSADVFGQECGAHQALHANPD
ncbi:hypothetical protein [Streptomyces chilikensis]|uniref:Uncharacterized protein n=1 Tax=Streptomyces chilikensis TaxID=1194079 RepID=A0ABV3EK85_9ACTN